MGEKVRYYQMLQEAATAQDVYKFISVYVSARESKVDLADEAKKMLIEMGEKAVESTAKMLNARNLSEEYRGTVAHCLMLAITSEPKVGNNDVVKSELFKALADVDYFVSANAKESLKAFGIKSISGIPIDEYASNLRDQRLQQEWNNLHE